MGNPHLVLFVDDDPERFHVAHIGEVLEHDELFPERTNVEFAKVDEDEIDARVWERGSGETMACGSGACAIAVTATEAGLRRSSIVRAVPGRRPRGGAPGDRVGPLDRARESRLRDHGRPRRPDGDGGR